MSAQENEKKDGKNCEVGFREEGRTILEICNGLPPEEGKRLLRAIKFFAVIAYISSGMIASLFWIALLLG